jgi:hypothetical protein
MSAAKAKKEAKKAKRLRRPGRTEVMDRFVGLPLGREAQMLAELMRDCGADPQLVPDLRDDAEKSAWLGARGTMTVPMYWLDWAAAILGQIPQRVEKKRGRPKQEAVRNVEFWDRYGEDNTAENARLVAALEVRKTMEPHDGETETEFGKRENEKIKDRSKALARRVYRRRKSDLR